MVNQSLVPDPTIRQPGFDLPRHTWSMLNRFRTGRGTCRADLHQCGLSTSESCSCGQKQTMSHIVDSCPLSRFEGGLQQSTQLTIAQFTGWRRRRKKHSRNEKKLPPGSAADLLPTYIFKQVIDLLAPFVVELFNLSLLDASPTHSRLHPSRRCRRNRY